MTSSQWRKFEDETAIDPDLPIIDTHHHIWSTKASPVFDPYTVDEMIADKSDCGHNVIATVLVDSHNHYRTTGPEHLRPVGETEFGEKVANEAMAKGGRVAGLCAAIATHADLCLGALVGEVFDAHIAASPRFRGIRHMLAYLPELPPYYGATEEHVSQKKEFREGFAELARRKLSYEAWAFQPQLGEVLDLARCFPDAMIVINHLGAPMQIGRYKGRREEALADWKKSMAALATCPNTVVKLGGAYLTQTEPTAIGWTPRPLSSEEIANNVRDYVLAAIDIFSPSRSMFESNFPVDMLWTSYGNQWNAYKRIVADFSDTERRDLFAGTARRVYRLK